MNRQANPLRVLHTSVPGYMLLSRALAPRLLRSRRLSFGGGGRGDVPLHKRVEEAARRGDLAEARRLLASEGEQGLSGTGLSLVAELERGRSASARSRGWRFLGGVLGYWLYNALATAYCYRVLGHEVDALLEGEMLAAEDMETEDMLATEGAGGGDWGGLIGSRSPAAQVQADLSLSSFELHAQIRRPLSAAERLARAHGALATDEGLHGSGGSDGGGTVIAMKQVRVFPLIHLSAIIFGSTQWTLRCRKYKDDSGRVSSRWHSASHSSDENAKTSDADVV